MIRYWISMRLEEGWSDWRQVSKQRYEHALVHPDYTTKVTEDRCDG